MYSVRIENRCLREMKQLDKAVARRALEIIKGTIAKDPESGKRLRGRYSGLYSFRFSDYRIVYEVKERQLLIVVLRVRHRKDVYDGL